MSPRCLARCAPGRARPPPPARPAASAMRTTTTVLVGQLGRALGGHEHIGAVGQQHDVCSAGTEWIAASRSLVDGLSVGPPSSAPTPSHADSSRKPSPVTTASAPQVLSAGRAPLPTPARASPLVAGLLDLDPPTPPTPPAPRAGVPLPTCSRHVGDVDAGDLVRRGQRHRGVRGIGVDVDLERRRVADDQHRVADLLELVDVDAAGPGRCR